jgi:hypothetical protein
MQGYILTGSTGFNFSKGDVSGSAAGSRADIFQFDCGFTKPGLIYLHPGWEVPCGICKVAGTISRHSRSSTNDVSADATVSSSVCG